MAVQVIAATSAKATGPSKPLRTAAYCRVSTDTDEQ